MKLKSLLAIVSCSTIYLNISVPSIADTVKDSQVKSKFTEIGNKQFTSGSDIIDNYNRGAEQVINGLESQSSATNSNTSGSDIIDNYNRDAEQVMNLSHY